jgi:hypothetical protein
MKAKTTTRSKNVWLLLRTITICFVCTGICFVSLWLLAFRPQYLEMDIAFPENNRWSFTEWTLQKRDSRAFYIIRKQGYCSDCAWERLLKHFDEQFARYHWFREENVIGNACGLYLPDAAFLSHNDYAVYTQNLEFPNELDYPAVPTACVVISGNNEIVLILANPAPLAVIWSY